MNRPAFLPGDDFWLRCYYELCTTRAVGATVAAQIPVTAMWDLADRRGLVGFSRQSFVDVMMALDRKHRAWHREEQDRERRKQERRDRRHARKAEAK